LKIIYTIHLIVLSSEIPEKKFLVAFQILFFLSGIFLSGIFPVESSAVEYSAVELSSVELSAHRI